MIRFICRYCQQAVEHFIRIEWEGNVGNYVCEECRDERSDST